MRKAVFLDRDGVINAAKIINGKPYPPKDIRELKILPGVFEALNDLHRKEYILLVVTNQPDVARGTTLKIDVELINNALKKSLPIDDFFTCYHDDRDKCICRKPSPGNILLAANKFKIDLAQSYLIGDRWRDIESGISAGCKTIFIDYNYNEKKPSFYDHKTTSLLEAAKIILKN
jgi:D-glycero-D-manno-heptose 1,7-bisphosphate phosphatase